MKRTIVCGIAFLFYLLNTDGVLVYGDESLQDLLNTEIDTAAKYSQTAREAPASITVITHKDIENYAYQTLDQVLASVPGFYTTLNRNYGYIGNRGFSRPTDSILVLLNGQRLNDNFYGFASVWTDLAIDLKSLERIEIIRGPGSALYGTGAMFAVINLVTRTGAAIDRAELDSRIGSYGNFGGDFRVGKTFENGADWMLSAQWQHSNGQDLYFKEFDSPGSNLGVANGRDWDGSYGLLATYRKDCFFFQANAVDRKKGIPTASYGTIFNSPFSATGDQRQSFQLGWSKQLNVKSLISVTGYWNRYHFIGDYPTTDGFYTDENHGQWLGTEIRWQWDPSPRNRFVAGMEYIYNPKASINSKLDNITYNKGNFPFATHSVYVQDEHQLFDNLSVTLGARYDKALKGNAVSPRLAVIYHASSQTTLKLLYGKAFRSPNAFETSYSGLTYVPNPDLRPETIRMMEGIWQQRIGNSIQTEVSFYQYRMKDLIEAAVNDADGTLIFKNLNSVKARGLEVSSLLRLPRGLQGYASYVYEDAEDADTRIVLTNSPKHIARLGTVLPVRPNLQVAAELRYESGRKTVYETQTQGAFLANLILRGQIPAGILKSFPLTLKIQNLFNADYSTPGGFEHQMPAINQNGRNYILDIGYNFDFKPVTSSAGK